MGKCTVTGLGGGAKFYTTKDFALVDGRSTGVRLPDGHVFSDFSQLMAYSRSGSYCCVWIKVSDTAVATAGIGTNDYKSFNSEYAVDPQRTILCEGYESSYGNVVVSAFGILK